jgi:hypothetical protein
MLEQEIKFLLGNKKPALYYAWWEEYYENLKKAGKLDPPRMLDSECVKHCGLKTMYLITCNSDASVYSLTNSPEWLHGGECIQQCRNAVPGIQPIYLSSLYWKYQDLPTITVTWISLVLHVIVIVGKLVSADCPIVQ